MRLKRVNGVQPDNTKKLCHTEQGRHKYYHSGINRSEHCMIYPVKDVLKTTSATWVPEAPKDFALHAEPSSRTRRASLSFHGLSAKKK
jgi:hypothetical protein